MNVEPGEKCPTCGERKPHPSLLEASKHNPYEVGDVVSLVEHCHTDDGVAEKGTRGKVTALIGDKMCSVLLDEPHAAFWIKNDVLQLEHREGRP